MIMTSPQPNLPEQLATILRSRGWLTVRPGQIFAIFWDQILLSETSDADKLMERVIEVHKIAAQLGLAHMFKTIKTSGERSEIPDLL